MTWHTTSRHARGYGTAWDKLRLQVLKRDGYVCQPCMKEGRIHSGSEVDHIVPKSAGGTDSLSNLQTIAKRCHEAKNLLDKGIKPKPRIGLDGWPVPTTGGGVAKIIGRDSRTVRGGPSDR